MASVVVGAESVGEFDNSARVAVGTTLCMTLCFRSAMEHRVVTVACLLIRPRGRFVDRATAGLDRSLWVVPVAEDWDLET